jgi:hypothetical protein
MPDRASQADMTCAKGEKRNRAARYRVIAPDLQELGDSLRPAYGCDKKTLAHDIWRLVRTRNLVKKKAGYSRAWAYARDAVVQVDPKG